MIAIRGGFLDRVERAEWDGLWSIQVQKLSGLAEILAKTTRKGLTVGAGICGAVEALTRALAVEMAPIRVNAVCPGLVRTEMWMSMSQEDQEAMARSIGQALLVGRVGEAHDLAHACLYLMREGCEHRSGDHRGWWDYLRLKHLFGEKCSLPPGQLFCKQA